MATALSLTHLGSLMRGVRSVDEVGADERAASLAKRSIKKSSKLWALDLAIRCMDLTTLEGQDTPGKVAALCAKAMRPKPGDATVPPVAAVCVYPDRKSTRLNSSHRTISYAVFCLKKKKENKRSTA